MRADAQADPVVTGIRRRTGRLLRRIAGDGGNREAALHTAGRRIVQVPNPAVHAAARRRRLRHPDPIRRNQLAIDLLLRERRRVCTRYASDQGPAGVEYLNRHGLARSVSEVVIDHCAIRRITSRRFIRLHRRIGACTALYAYRRRGLQQCRLARREIRIELPQRTNVVQHPK